VPVRIKNCHSVRETEKAVLIESENFDSDSCQEWIPKSQIHDDSEIWKADQKGDLVIHDWFARINGWE
jgi:hypothetical protein